MTYNDNMIRRHRTTPAARGLFGALALAAAVCSTSTFAQVEPPTGQAQTPPAQADGQQRITLNLKDADITALISTVAEVTGRNFVVDPRVKARVTVISQDPIPAEELYQVFLSVLQVHGFAAVPSGEVTKIVPDINAKQLGSPITGATTGPDASDEIVTRVLTVDNVPVAQLVPILRPLVPQQGHLAAYPPTNVLIISDRAGNIDRIQDIVSRIDRVADDNIEVVRLEYASAAEIARIVASLQQVDPNQPPANVKIAVDERINAVLLGGDKSERLKMLALIAHLDVPVEGTGDTRVVYLRYAKAEELLPVLTGVGERIVQDQEAAAPAQGAPGGAPGAGAGARNTEFDLQAEPGTNALVVTGPPAIQKALETVIRQLDIRRAQVLVEAAIAEILLSKDREFGVDVGAIDRRGEVPAFASLLGVLSPSLLGFFAADNLTEVGQVAAAAGIPTGFNVALGDTDGRYRFGALVRALASDTTSNILSTPSLVTLDNEEAEIRVAQNLPFITGTFTNETGGVGNPFQTIEREDVGIILKVKPQINEGNDILLELEQEVSNLTETTEAGPVTNKRSIKTTVIVEDGQILALGGLIDEQVTEAERKVPILGDVPLLGKLFSAQTTSKAKRNLVLFLQPSILRGDGVINAYTGRKYNYFRAEQLTLRERGIPLMGNEGTPLLPNLERPELPAPFEVE